MVFKVEKYMENTDSSSVMFNFLSEAIKDYDVNIYTSSGSIITVPNNYHYIVTDDLIRFFSNDNIEEIVVYRDTIIGMKKKN